VRSETVSGENDFEPLKCLRAVNSCVETKCRKWMEIWLQKFNGRKAFMEKSARINIPHKQLCVQEARTRGRCLLGDQYSLSTKIELERVAVEAATNSVELRSVL
jgi:hypothetical protein